MKGRTGDCGIQEIDRPKALVRAWRLRYSIDGLLRKHQSLGENVKCCWISMAPENATGSVKVHIQQIKYRYTPAIMRVPPPHI